MTVSKAQKLAIAKLKESDLTLADAKKLGIEVLDAKKTGSLFPMHKVPSLKFKYHDLKGKVRRDTCRVRLLEVEKGSFGETPTKPIRYLQPKDSPVAAYFPKTIKWQEVKDDPEVTLIITEGELKAACAAKHGYKCIGLGGVSSWRSAARGWSLLPELEEFEWQRRDVIIVYDSDSATNPAVAAACGAFVNELSRRGAYPAVANLPPLDDEEGKTGLDDFIVELGVEAFKLVLDEAESDELTRKLWDFNSRFVYVLNPGIVRDEIENQNHRASDFKQASFSNVWALESSTNPPRKVQVAKTWVDWPQRRQVRSMTYAPGQGKITEENTLNTWLGWGVEPIKASVKPWHDLLNLLFSGSTREAHEWFENWCLYPIAHPGTKLQTAVGMWSRGQGQGKSTIGVTLKHVYGLSNFAAISQKVLESSFNGWGSGKQFVMVDDVSSYDSRAKADILKTLITQEEILVNTKFVPEYFVPDTINYYLTSNHPNAFYLDADDRRFFIHEVVIGKRSEAYYSKYRHWLTHGGAEALLHYAQFEHKFGSFSPHAAAPNTSAKEEMMLNVKSELGAWLTDLAKDPDGLLRMGEVEFVRDIYTPTELLALFEGVRKGRPVAVNTMGMVLKSYFKQVAVLKVDKTSERFYAVRNATKWLRASRKTMLEHVRKGRERERSGKGRKF